MFLLHIQNVPALPFYLSKFFRLPPSVCRPDRGLYPLEVEVDLSILEIYLFLPRSRALEIYLAEVTVTLFSTSPSRDHGSIHQSPCYTRTRIDHVHTHVLLVEQFRTRKIKLLDCLENQYVIAWTVSKIALPRCIEGPLYSSRDASL